MAVVFDPSINNLIAVKNGNGDMGKNVALQIRAALTMILGRPPTKDDFIPKPNSKTTTSTSRYCFKCDTIITIFGHKR